MIVDILVGAEGLIAILFNLLYGLLHLASLLLVRLELRVFHLLVSHVRVGTLPLACRQFVFLLHLLVFLAELCLLRRPLLGKHLKLLFCVFVVKVFVEPSDSRSEQK